MTNHEHGSKAEARFCVLPRAFTVPPSPSNSEPVSGRRFLLIWSRYVRRNRPRTGCWTPRAISTWCTKGKHAGDQLARLAAWSADDTVDCSNFEAAERTRSFSTSFAAPSLDLMYTLPTVTSRYLMATIRSKCQIDAPCHLLRGRRGRRERTVWAGCSQRAARARKAQRWYAHACFPRRRMTRDVSSRRTSSYKARSIAVVKEATSGAPRALRTSASELL